MFARSAEYEELFTRGYPHLRRLVTPHPDEADAAARATKVLTSLDSIHYHVDWPAEVAYRFVRALPHVGADGIGFLRPSKVALAGLAKAGPLDEQEGRALLAKLVDPALNAYEFAIEHCLYLLEAMIGSEAAADAILSKLESMKQLDGAYSTPNYIAYRLGFILRRLSPSARAAAEARVRGVIAKHPEPASEYTREFLSFTVGGRAALDATDRKLGLYCVHFADDPALLVSLARDSCAYFDANHAYQAGDAILDALGASLGKIAAPRKPWLVDELAPIASKKVEPILATLGQTKKLAARVDAVLAARGGRAPVPAKTPPAKKPPAKKPPAKKPPKKR